MYLVHFVWTSVYYFPFLSPYQRGPKSRNSLTVQYCGYQAIILWWVNRIKFVLYSFFDKLIECCISPVVKSPLKWTIRKLKKILNRRLVLTPSGVYGLSLGQFYDHHRHRSNISGMWRSGVEVMLFLVEWSAWTESVFIKGGFDGQFWFGSV